MTSPQTGQFAERGRVEPFWLLIHGLTSIPPRVFRERCNGTAGACYVLENLVSACEKALFESLSRFVYLVILQPVNACLSLARPLSVTFVPESLIVLHFLNEFRYSSPAFVTCVLERSRKRYCQLLCSEEFFKRRFPAGFRL